MAPQTNQLPTRSEADRRSAPITETTLKMVLFASVFVLPFVSGSVAYLSSIRVLGGFAGSPEALIGEFLWTKLLVDVVLSLAGLLFLILVGSKRYLKIARTPFFFIFVGTILVSAIPSLLYNPLLAVAGARFFYPVLFFFVGMILFSEREVRVLGRVFVLMAVAAAFLGIAQFFLSGASATGRVGHVYGVYSIFTFPSTFSSVLGVAGAFLITDKEWAVEWRIGCLGILFVAILLSRSGTGIAVAGTILAVWLYRNRSFLWLVAVAAAGISALPVLTGRANIWRSLYARIEIFLEFLETGTVPQILFGRGAGFGTDISATLERLGYLSTQTVIADSLYNSLFLQVGLVGLMAFLLFAIVLLSNTKRIVSDLSDLLSYLVPVVLAVSVTRNTFEVFPINIVFWIVCGAFVGLVVRSQQDGTANTTNESDSHNMPNGTGQPDSTHNS